MKPELVRAEGIDQVAAGSHEYHQGELSALLGHLAGYAGYQQGASRDKTVSIEQIRVGDLVLVAYGEVFGSLKWPAFKLKSYGS